MGKVHGKGTYVSLGGEDISQYCNSNTPNRSADEHDTTTYGQDSHVFTGGLKSGTNTIGGFYDDGVDGPEAVIEPMLSTVVTLIWRPAGTGTGKPEKTVQALVKSFNTSMPVADMVTFTIELTFSGSVVRSVQA